MLTIRLTRKGKKNQPFFRVVLVDKRKSSTSGRSIEDLGFVDPLKKRKSFKKERIQYWLSKGAKASATIHNLLVTEKIIDAKKIHVSRLSKKTRDAAAKVIADKAVADAKTKTDKAVADKAEAAKAEAEKAAAAKAAPAVAESSGETKQEPKPADVK